MDEDNKNYYLFGYLEGLNASHTKPSKELSQISRSPKYYKMQSRKRQRKYLRILDDTQEIAERYHPLLNKHFAFWFRSKYIMLEFDPKPDRFIKYINSPNKWLAWLWALFLLIRR